METSRAERALRIALVVYMSPVLLIVLTIGCVGMIFSRREVKPVVASSNLAHAAQEASPLAIGKTPVQVRQRV